LIRLLQATAPLSDRGNASFETDDRFGKWLDQFRMIAAVNHSE